MLRDILAPNPSPMTLDGTRTYLVGSVRVAVIDPGPDDPAHLDAVADAVGDGVCVGILLTHMHPDHSRGAVALADRLDAPVRANAQGTLRDGDVVDTDAGGLVAVATPGHTPDHVALHWPAADAVFCGDLMMGGLDTALVAAPEGDLGRYLASLAIVRALRPRVVHPAHGASFDDPDAAIDAYVAHRAGRERQVLDALEAGATGADDIAAHVYGDTIPPEFAGIVRDTTRAYLEHLEATGRLPGRMR